MATHAYTASPTTAGDLHVPLMPMQLDENPCPRRGHHGLFKVVAVSVLLALGIGFGVFFGGFYLGKAQTSSCDAPASSAASSASTSSASSTAPPQSAAVMVSLGGRSVTLSAITGNMPTSSFMQCVMAPSSSNPAGVQCMPANSLLTPPGSVLLTLYQFQGEYSLIVTATGSKYGTPMTGSTNNVEANFTVHISGLNGAHINAPHLLPGSVVLTNGMATTNVIVREHDSLNTVFSQLRMTPSFLMSNYLTGNTGDLAMFVMGANLQPVFLGDSLPTKTNPITIGWAGMQAQAPVPIALVEEVVTYEPVYSNANFKISQAQSTGRRRRGFWSGLANTLVNGAVNYGMNYLVDLFNGDGQQTHRVHVSYDRLGSLGLTFNITQLETDTTAAANAILTLSGNNVLNGADATNLITAATTVYTDVSNDLAGLSKRRGLWTQILDAGVSYGLQYGLSLLQSTGSVPPLTSRSAIDVTPDWAINALSMASNYLQQAENALSGNRRSSCGQSLWSTLSTVFTCGKGIYQGAGFQSDFTNCGSAVQNGYNYYHNCASQGTWWRRSVDGQQ